MNKEYTSEDLERLSKQQHHQFIQWLLNLFLIDEKLNEEYDAVYQDSYYIKLHDLLIYGIKHVNEKKDLLNKYPEEEKNWYIFLSKELLNLRNEISKTEFEHIEYKRHNACHIFQVRYEVKEDKEGNIKKPHKSKEKESINNILDIHENDYNFDIYFTKKYRPKLVEINNKSKKIIERAEKEFILKYYFPKTSHFLLHTSNF
jgi:hypothetical protein